MKQVADDMLFKDIDNKSDFYHCHSYIFKTKDKKNIIGFSNYKEKSATVIKKDNVYGVQFHPEKSLKFGLKLLENFLKNWIKLELFQQFFIETSQLSKEETSLVGE